LDPNRFNPKSVLGKPLPGRGKAFSERCRRGKAQLAAGLVDGAPGTMHLAASRRLEANRQPAPRDGLERGDELPERGRPARAELIDTNGIPVERRRDGASEVADVEIVASLRCVAIDGQRFAQKSPLDESRHGALLVSRPGPIDIGETQGQAGKTVRAGKGRAIPFDGKLRRAIGGEWRRRHTFVNGRRHLPEQRPAGRCVYDAANARAACQLEQLERAQNVDREARSRIRYRVDHSGKRCKVNYRVDIREARRHCFRIGEIGPAEVR
jgi:hypothetical protein